MITKRGSVYYVVIRYKTSNEVWKKKWIRAGASRRDALRVERKYMQDRNTASTMREFFDQWLDASVKPPSRSAGTYENYQYCAEKLCAYIGNVRIDRLTPLHLTKAYKALLGDGLSATTVRMCHRVVRAALNKAVRWHMIPANPALSADTPQRTPSPAQALDVEKALSLLRFTESMNVYARLVVSLEMLCGMRRYAASAGRTSIRRRAGSISATISAAAVWRASTRPCTSFPLSRERNISCWTK